jgi:hypothetical protein
MNDDYAAFRRDLDAVLALRNPQALRAFMVERGQWPADTTMDPEVALWLMIAASPNPKALHAEARAWLAAHGRDNEAAAIAGRPGAPPVPRRPGPKRPKKR